MLMRPFVGACIEVVGHADPGIDDHSPMDIAEARRIRESVGTMVIGLNAMSPWLLEAADPPADGLLIGFESDYALGPGPTWDIS